MIIRIARGELLNVAREGVGLLGVMSKFEELYYMYYMYYM